MEWVLKKDADLAKWSGHELNYAMQRQKYRQIDHGPWILQDINHYYRGGRSHDDYSEEEIDHHYGGEHDEDYYSEEIEWDSEEEYIENIDVRRYRGYIDILGFHPFEEIIFLSDTMERGLAFHFDNSEKVEDLGCLCPRFFSYPSQKFITSSFPYTPSWL